MHNTCSVGPKNKKQLLSVAAISADTVSELIKLAVELKHGRKNSCCKGKSVALLFEKPSLRTRVSFEVAVQQLGGHSIYLSPSEVGLGAREQVPDVARTLSRYVQCIVARTFSHKTLELLAEHATVPVINALSDLEHPCQALADSLTIYEKKGYLRGLTLSFIGDGNNVANSLLLAAAQTGMNFAIACPPGYELSTDFLKLAQKCDLQGVMSIRQTADILAAVKGTDIVYTDVWTSMGQETERESRCDMFTSYQVTRDLLSLAKKDVLFMHPLPAHHGEEIEEGLLDHPSSVVFDQAENRLHIQKAILVHLLGS